MSTTNTWYSKTTNTGSPHEQGLVIDETTGKNIAVTYDAKHAPLVASAPELLAALLQAELVIRHAAQEGAGRIKKEIVGGWLYHANQVRAAIAKATA